MAWLPVTLFSLKIRDGGFVSDTSSTAVGYKLTIGGRIFEQTANDGLEMLVFEDHVDMVDLLSVRIGGTESQPEWDFNIVVGAHSTYGT